MLTENASHLEAHSNLGLGFMRLGRVRLSYNFSGESRYAYLGMWPRSGVWSSSSGPFDTGVVGSGRHCLCAMYRHTRHVGAKVLTYGIWGDPSSSKREAC